MGGMGVLGPPQILRFDGKIQLLDIYNFSVTNIFDFWIQMQPNQYTVFTVIKAPTWIMPHTRIKAQSKIICRN